ncbi:MAG: hypothetical protein KAG61_00355, partial [Bacteriovoracaceae bacterium]|nr:hypothetical protein [Bacteriovoracaceae bacterium]
SPKAVFKSFDKYRIELNKAGALERNYKLWYPREDPADHGNFKYIATWLERRFKFLDHKWNFKL